MFYSTRSKLIASFLIVTSLVGAVSLFIGSRLLYKAVLDEATIRVRSDLNAAVEIYQSRLKTLTVSLKITTLGSGFVTALRNRNLPELKDRLKRLVQHADLDLAGIVSEKGEILCRMGSDPVPTGASHPDNPLLRGVLNLKKAVSGSVLFSEHFLKAENPQMARLAKIPLILPSGSSMRAVIFETSGMAVGAAIPVLENQKWLGVLYGAIVLNRSKEIVDTVWNTVFLQETYKNQNIGRASIFLRNLRISTNVMTQNGLRAVGTKVSDEVKARVLEMGKRYTQRALVVNDWYITSYEPITDIFGQRIGMIGVGVLEKKYVAIRRKMLVVFIVITLTGMALAAGLGGFLAERIMRPVKRLIHASLEVSEGNLWPSIGPISKDEIGVLQNTFRHMIVSLSERDRKRVAESEKQLLHSEKQASVGRLAAGVAHEINNPLTGVLTYTHMLLRRKDLCEDIRADLNTIAKSTERVRDIVKGLLEFSRQTELHKEPTDINRVVQSAISLMQNQALVKGVGIEFHQGDNLPEIIVDRSQFQGVLLNMIINALDATERMGKVMLITGLSASTDNDGQQGIEITITDTGKGITKEELDKIFEPFYTTKAAGRGTGLGLAVSLGIVQRHGGTIRVESDVGKGTTFVIHLPIENENASHENFDRR